MSAKSSWTVLAIWAPSSSALAHSGPHLDEKTIEAIFQFADRVYLGFVANLPLIAGIAAGVVLLLAAVKLFRRRAG